MKNANQFREIIREALKEKAGARIDETRIALDEVSSHLLGRYIKKASQKANDLSHRSGLEEPSDYSNKLYKKASKRKKGIDTATNKLVAKASGMPPVNEEANALRASRVINMAIEVLSNLQTVNEAAVDPAHETKERDHKIKMLFHVKDNGLHAKTHNGKVYRLNPAAVDFKIPRVDSYLDISKHQVVEGMIDYPDNAEPAYSPKEVQAMLNTFKRNSSVKDPGSKDYSRVTIDPLDDDEEKKIEEEIVQEIAAELSEELESAASGTTDSFDVEFDGGESFEISSDLAGLILREGDVTELVRASKTKSGFEQYIKKIGG